MRNFRLDDESGHQEALFSWAAYRTEIMPELQYMYHVPNGGKRDAATAVALKRQGVKAGVPDIMLPAARAGYHGLYIELKAGKNTTTKKQKECACNHGRGNSTRKGGRGRFRGAGHCDRADRGRKGI